jgi:hypothetical protein
MLKQYVNTVLFNNKMQELQKYRKKTTVKGIAQAKA